LRLDHKHAAQLQTTPILRKALHGALDKIKVLETFREKRERFKPLPLETKK
jgi:hypothetical protein